MESIVIRNAKVEDVEGIVKVINESILSTHTKLYPKKDIDEKLNYYNENKVRELIQDYSYFVAESSDGIVGCILAKENKMMSLYILPNYMGKGLGKKLVCKIEEVVRSNGYDYIYLWSSLVARKFYTHLGYDFVKDIENEEGIVLHFEMVKRF